MNGTLLLRRLPVVALLLLCTLPSRVDAQPFVCQPIAAGDTASSLARRLTGSAAAAYGLAFQIRDPVRRMFVPKSHYQRLQSDWQACVAPGPAPKTAVAYAPVVELAASAIVPDPPIPTTPPALASPPLTVALVDRTPIHVPFAGMTGAALLFIVVLSTAVLLAPRPIPPSVRRDGENFVTVFARPLIDESSRVPPIQTRLRYRRRQQQLELSIAPARGHRYPNLADHKKNVEYDIDRVLRVLGNHVLSKPPRANGKWVIVTIKPITPGTSSPDPLLAHSLTARALHALRQRTTGTSSPE